MYTRIPVYIKVIHLNPTYPQPYSVESHVGLQVLIIRIHMCMYIVLECTVRCQQACFNRANENTSLLLVNDVRCFMSRASQRIRKSAHVLVAFR